MGQGYTVVLLIPMVVDYYGVPIERANLQTLLMAALFLATAPLAHLLVKSECIRRRILIYLSFFAFGIACFTRSGFGSHYNLVSLSSCLIGASYGILQTSVVAEIIGAVEETRIYARNDPEQLYLDLSSWLTLFQCVALGAANLMANMLT